MKSDKRNPAVERTTKLTFAVRLLDAYAEQPITSYEQAPATAVGGPHQRGRRRRDTIRYPRLTLAEIDVDPVLNKSGFHLFLDVPTVTPDDDLHITVDGGQRYLNKSLPVESEALAHLPRDPEAPPPPDETARYRLPEYQEIRLRPSPAYQFPTGATLLRGYLQDDQENGIKGATLTIVGLDQTTETVDGGEFVLYFKPPHYDVWVEDGTRFIEINGQAPQIGVNGGPVDSTVSLTAEEGTTRSYRLRYEAGELFDTETSPQ